MQKSMSDALTHSPTYSPVAILQKPTLTPTVAWSASNTKLSPAVYIALLILVVLFCIIIFAGGVLAYYDLQRLQRIESARNALTEGAFELSQIEESEVSAVSKPKRVLQTSINESALLDAEENDDEF